MTRKAERDLALIVSCVRGAIDPDHSLELGGKEVRDLDCCHALIYLYMPMSIYRSVCLSVCLSLSLSTHLPTYLSIYLYVYSPIYLSVYLSIHLSTYLSICLDVWMYGCLSVCLYTPVGTYHLYIYRYK